MCLSELLLPAYTIVALAVDTDKHIRAALVIIARLFNRERG